MAKEIASELRSLIDSKKIIIGTKRTLKYLISGKLDKVFLSSNPPKAETETVKLYCKSGNVKLEVLDIPNDELGVICRKPFSISMLGVPKLT